MVIGIAYVGIIDLRERRSHALFRKNALWVLKMNQCLQRIFRPTVTTEGVSFFHQNFVPDHTKIQDIQEGLSFSPEF